MQDINTALDGWYQELRDQGAAALQRGLDERLITAVRDGYETWRAEEDEAVATAFEHLCDRFWSRIQESLDALLRYSAELFAIPFTAIATGSLWRTGGRFHYKFWREPPLMLFKPFATQAACT